MLLRIFYTILFFIGFSCLQACKQTPRPDLLTTPKWKLVGVISRPWVEAKRDSIPIEPTQKERVNITYQFHKDKKYTFLRGSQRDEGEWGMSSDEKVLLLRSRINEKDHGEFRIHALNVAQLVMSSEHKGRQEILYFTATE